MSFILDALKKSEAERRQGEVPRLQNEPFTPPPRRRPVWPLLLALALLLNAGVFGWWLLAGPVPKELETKPELAAAAGASALPEARPQVPVAMLPAEPDIVTEVMDEPAVRAAAPLAADTPAQSVAREPQIPAAPAATAAKPKAAAPRPAADAYPPIAELPGNVRASLPRLELQLHFFTPEPERRLVRLNGMNLRQGGSSGDGLNVVEITPQGVKLAYGGHRFFLPTARP